MKRIFSFFKDHINSWEEICMNERSRLRVNVILFTLFVSTLYVGMLVLNLISRSYVMTVPTLILAVISIMLFVLQLKNKQYNPVIAWAFGVMALGMSAYLLYTGGLDGLSHLWLFLVPNIAIMVVSLKHSILYNALFLLMVILLMQTPLRLYLQNDYSPTFRILFPLALLFCTCCAYLTELVRHKTQRQLVSTASKLQSFAFTDPLTGIFNRRAIMSHFGDLGGEAFGLSFAMLDLDFFKRVNDDYGHATGDRMLCHVVRVVSQSIPPNALLYRWGGEEFLLILKTHDCAAVERLLGEICRAVEATPLREEATDVRMTVSIGGVCAKPGEMIKSCIEEADRRLYEAKGSGRNRVVLYDDATVGLAASEA